MAQKVSFWIVSKMAGRKVAFVNPNPWRKEEAREYCIQAAKRGQQFAMTRVDVVVDFVGKPPARSVSLVA